MASKAGRGLVGGLSLRAVPKANSSMASIDALIDRYRDSAESWMPEPSLELAVRLRIRHIRDGWLLSLPFCSSGGKISRG